MYHRNKYEELLSKAKAQAHNGKPTIGKWITTVEQPGKFATKVEKVLVNANGKTVMTLGAKANGQMRANGSQKTGGEL